MVLVVMANLDMVGGQRQRLVDNSNSDFVELMAAQGARLRFNDKGASGW